MDYKYGLMEGDILLRRPADGGHIEGLFDGEWKRYSGSASDWLYEAKPISEEQAQKIQAKG